MAANYGHSTLRNFSCNRLRETTLHSIGCCKQLPEKLRSVLWLVVTYVLLQPDGILLMLGRRKSTKRWVLGFKKNRNLRRTVLWRRIRAQKRCHHFQNSLAKFPPIYLQAVTWLYFFLPLEKVVIL